MINNVKRSFCVFFLNNYIFVIIVHLMIEYAVKVITFFFLYIDHRAHAIFGYMDIILYTYIKMEVMNRKRKRAV